MLGKVKWSRPRTPHLRESGLRYPAPDRFCFITLSPLPLGCGEIGSDLDQMVLTSTVVRLKFSLTPRLPSLSPGPSTAALRVPVLTSATWQGGCLPFPLAASPFYFSTSSQDYAKGSQLFKPPCYNTSIYVVLTFSRAFSIIISFYLHNSTLWVRKAVVVTPHFMIEERKAGEEKSPTGATRQVGGSIRTCLIDGWGQHSHKEGTTHLDQTQASISS